MAAGRKKIRNQPDRICREREVREMLGNLDHSTFWKLWARHRAFPRPLDLGIRATGWRLSDVQEWIRSREPREVSQDRASESAP